MAPHSGMGARGTARRQRCACARALARAAARLAPLPMAPHAANASTALSPNSFFQACGLNQMNAYRKCGAASAAASAQGEGHRRVGLAQLARRARSSPRPPIALPCCAISSLS
jgi:hypothetical protein